MKTLNEYVSYSETISLIKEYLLSKKNKKLPDDKYYVILTGNQQYLEFEKCIKMK